MKNVSDLKERIQKNKIVQTMNKFYSSYIFIAVIGLLALLSNLFAMEIYAAFIATLLLGSAFILCEDTKPFLTLIFFFASAESYKNGLSHRPENTESIYSNEKVMIYFFILCGILLLTLLFHLIVYEDYKKVKKCNYPILLGIIILGITYMLGGIFTEEYSINNLMFGFLNMMELLSIYVYFKATAFNDGKEKAIKYMGYVALVFEIMMIGEIIGIYVYNNPIDANGTINKTVIATGWAEHNYLGMYMLLLSPFLFYLSMIEKRPIFFQIIIVLSAVGILFTESRTALLFTAIFYVIMALFVCIYKNRNRKKNIIFYSICIALCLVCYAIKFDQINQMFAKMIKNGASLNGRDHIYQVGIDAFKSNVISGKGWFYLNKQLGVPSYVISNMFASPYWKYHDIFIQLIATCGLIGVIGFIAHLFSIGKVYYKNGEKLLGLIPLASIVILICVTIFDNAFFDYGFERFYAVFLILVSLPDAHCNNKIANVD